MNGLNLAWTGEIVDGAADHSRVRLLDIEQAGGPGDIALDCGDVRSCLQLDRLEGHAGFSNSVGSALNVFPFSALPPSQAARDAESLLSALVCPPEILPKHQLRPEIQTKGGWPSPGRDYRRR